MTINIHNESKIQANGTHINQSSKPVLCIDTGEVFASMTDAAERFDVKLPCISAAVNGKSKTCKGYRFCLVSRADENLDVITEKIRHASELEQKAAAWDVYQAQQEAIRKAEEKRQDKINKASERLERRRRIEERLRSQLDAAIARREETERELEELNGKEVAVA